MCSKRLFVSDVHIGAGTFKATGYDHAWDWLSPKEKENFVSFLNFLRTDLENEYDDIVFLGDLFDNWIFPHDREPPSIRELLTEPCNAAVVSALQNLVKDTRTKVCYVPGNHDMHASRAIMKEFFPDFIYCPEQFIAGRMLAEHGHRYALFNAPPKFTNNIMGLPLGYFLSRIDATRKAQTNSDSRNYRTYLDDALELLGKQTLSQCVLEALLEEANLDEDTKFILKKRDGSTFPVKASEVKETYKDLYDDWPATIVSKPRAVFAELDKLGPVADLLCKHGKRQVCVMGHSHKAEIDKDSWFGDTRVYANSGFWCGSNCTFVDVEKDDNSNYTVKLGRWSNGTVNYKKENTKTVP